MYANTNGMEGKDASIRTAAEEYQADIICVTETKMIPPNIDGYAKWFHKGRSGRTGGWVAITVKENLTNKTTEIENLETEDQEIIWIQIETTGRKKIHIGTYYGKQETENKEQIEREYSQIESRIGQLKRKGPIILTGDFNAKLQINHKRVV